MVRHTQPTLDNADVDTLDWSADARYQLLDQQRETMRQRLHGLPTAQKTAHDELEQAQRAIERERQYLRQGGGDLRALQEARVALVRAQERHQALLTEEEELHTALASLQQEINELARELAQQLDAQLDDAYAEAARDLAEILPELRRRHERVRVIYNARQRNIPIRLQSSRPSARPELDQLGVPPAPKFSWLMIRELFDTPQGSRCSACRTISPDIWSSSPEVAYEYGLSHPATLARVSWGPGTDGDAAVAWRYHGHPAGEEEASMLSYAELAAQYPHPPPAPPAYLEPTVMGPFLATLVEPYPRYVQELIAQYDHVRWQYPQLLPGLLITIWWEYARHIPTITSPRPYTRSIA